MRLRFRARLLTIMGVTALGFVVLLGIQALLAKRMASQTTAIQEHYIPIIEYGPRLATDFEHLRRHLQDAVAAQDPEALSRTKDVHDHMVSDIQVAAEKVTTMDSQELTGALDQYYGTALGVSKRILSGETGTALVGSMTDMQTKQAKVEAILHDTLSFDRQKLAQAFSTIDRARDDAFRALITTSVACLVAVLLLTLFLSRSVLRSLGALSSGLGRFEKGQFNELIDLTSGDEFEDLARDANQMARRIKTLLRELESFSYSVAHDLRAPLRAVMGFSNILIEDHGPQLSSDAKDVLNRVLASTQRMGQLVDSLLGLSRLARSELKRERIDLAKIARQVFQDLQAGAPERKGSLVVQDELIADADAGLMLAVLTNLLSNAWKFSSKREFTRIEMGAQGVGRNMIYFVRDHGAGFDMQYATKLFGAFQRLHSVDEFEGTGIGLATVRTIIHRHGGEVWAESQVDQGATFFFTLGGTNGNKHDPARGGQPG